MEALVCRGCLGVLSVVTRLKAYNTYKVLKPRKKDEMLFHLLLKMTLQIKFQLRATIVLYGFHKSK